MRMIHEPVDTEPTFITQLVAMLETALQNEHLAWIEAVDAENKLARAKNVILFQGYRDGAIENKIVVAPIQENKLLNDDDDYRELLARVLDTQETFTFVMNDRKVVECRVGLMKAWLLSRCEYSSPDVTGPVSSVSVTH